MPFGQNPVALAQLLEVLLASFLDVDELVISPLDGPDQLVQLELRRTRFAILGVLDE